MIDDYFWYFLNCLQKAKENKIIHGDYKSISEFPANMLFRNGVSEERVRFID